MPVTVITAHAINSQQNVEHASQRKYNFNYFNQHVKEHANACADTLQTCEFNNFNVKPVDENGHDAFRATARVQRDVRKRSQDPRTLNTLMDPGAEINLIRGEFLKGKGKNSALKQHATIKQNIELTNNGKVIGHIHEAVYLSFVLDTVAGVATQTYSEWFHVLDNLHEELVLGSKFCKEQCFTNFHKRLQPWVNNRTPAMQAKFENAQRAANAISAGRRLDSIDAEFDQPEPQQRAKGDNPRGEPDANSVLWDITLGEATRDYVYLQQNGKRERVETACERIDAHAAKHAATTMLLQSEVVAGKRRRAKRLHESAPTLKTHENHRPTAYQPVQYNEAQTRHIANVLARRAIDEQKML